MVAEAAVESDAVAPGRLGFVHGGVRTLDQALEVVAALQLGDADRFG
jgi:hypothetical protein